MLDGILALGERMLVRRGRYMILHPLVFLLREMGSRTYHGVVAGSRIEARGAFWDRLV